jgi:hypothetical protein
MKSTWFGALLLAGLLSISLFSCVKDEDDDAKPTTETNNTPRIGGIGGKATLKVIPHHNGVDVDSCFIYIAYNTLDTTQRYDDSGYCYTINGRPTVTFNNLKPGDYFIAGKGWDLYKSVKVSGVRAISLEDSTTQYTVELPLN